MRSLSAVKAIYCSLVSLLVALGCADKPAREATLIRSSACEDTYRPAICPGETDCYYDERTGCQLCTCNSDEHEVDALPSHENER